MINTKERKLYDHRRFAQRKDTLWSETYKSRPISAGFYDGVEIFQTVIWSEAKQLYVTRLSTSYKGIKSIITRHNRSVSHD